MKETSALIESEPTLQHATRHATRHGTAPHSYFISGSAWLGSREIQAGGARSGGQAKADEPPGQGWRKVGIGWGERSLIACTGVCKHKPFLNRRSPSIRAGPLHRWSLKAFSAGCCESAALPLLLALGANSPAFFQAANGPDGGMQVGRPCPARVKPSRGPGSSLGPCASR